MLSKSACPLSIKLRLTVASLIVFASLLVWATVPANAVTSEPKTVEQLERQSNVTAYNRQVAYSRYNKASDNFQLVVQTLGSETPAEVLPIAPRSIAFDADLGPGEDGETKLVYSRCSNEPDGDYYGQKLWPSNAEGCDVYLYDFSTKKERKLTSFSTKGASEFLPTIWKDKVAFARSYGSPSKNPNIIRTPLLYTHSTDGNESSERQSQGTVKGLDRLSLSGLDLFGQRLALTRRFFLDSEGGTSQARVSTLGSGSRMLSQRRSGLTQRILRSPQFHRGRVLWTEQCGADLGGCSFEDLGIWRSRIAVKELSFSKTPNSLVSTALILDSVWWVRSPANYSAYDNGNACQASDLPDPNSRCLLQTAFVTFSPRGD